MLNENSLRQVECIAILSFRYFQMEMYGNVFGVFFFFLLLFGCTEIFVLWGFLFDSFLFYFFSFSFVFNFRYLLAIIDFIGNNSKSHRLVWFWTGIQNINQLHWSISTFGCFFTQYSTYQPMLLNLSK